MTTAPVRLSVSARATAPARLPQAAGAAVLSILGSMAIIGLVAVSLLVVPIAALVVFGPALFALL